MEVEGYAIAWSIYLLAAVGFSILAWSVFRKYLQRDLAYLFECFLVAVLFTPWYVVPDEQVMAPAFIVFLMDSITLDPVSGIRALIPLVMALLLALLVSLVLSVGSRLVGRRK